MYISPFWTYRDLGVNVVIASEISGGQITVPAAYLRAMQRAYEDLDQRLADEIVDAVEPLHIIFPDSAAAERWLDTALGGASVGMPNVDQIELTNRCPYVCPMCPRTTSMQRSLGKMPLPLFELVIEQISRTQDYTALHHFGESLLHPEIDSAVRIALGHGVRTGLSCNPPSLTPALSRRLLDAGLANMVLSLDSLDADTYRSIRGHAARLDKADKHVRELIAMRNEGGHGTWVTLQMIAMRANQAEVDQFLEYCADVGVDRGIVVRLGRWDFSDDYIATLGEHESPGYTAPCRLPQTSTVVLWDGRVVPCCHDYDGDVVLGDLTKESLAEIWAGPVAKRFRNRNAEYELCQKCAFSIWYKERQRSTEGFLKFHRARVSATSTRYEWTNPVSLARGNGADLFDRFDVYTRD